LLIICCRPSEQAWEAAAALISGPLIRQGTNFTFNTQAANAESMFGLAFNISPSSCPQITIRMPQIPCDDVPFVNGEMLLLTCCFCCCCWSTHLYNVIHFTFTNNNIIQARFPVELLVYQKVMQCAQSHRLLSFSCATPISRCDIIMQFLRISISFLLTLKKASNRFALSAFCF